MTLQLRPYQLDAVEATLAHFRRSNEAAVIVLPTGAGKSLVIAELARLAKRRILVLAHVKELVEQNHSKYQSHGLQASIFAAGLNRKESSEQVVFGSVQSVARNLPAFAHEFSLIIIDECHRVSLDENSQYQQIINALSQFNPDLKVLGLTATPYRLDAGWIYQQHRQLNCIRTQQDTAFRRCIFELPLRYMIEHNFLTPAKLLDAPVALYDFEQLRPSSNGYYNESDLNRILSGSKRATTRITEQIIEQAKNCQGVMIFAATVAHAKEILGYLPADRSAVILGDMQARARDSVIQAFKNKQIKFLVNVSVLTTGFDAPHVDLIAILRPTESVALYQQIIGRGLRLHEGKTECLVLDYAGNQFDLFQPQIDDPKPDSDAVPVQVNCPACEHQNHFWGLVDNDGDLVEHYGRRCQGLIENSDGEKQQCDFRYRFKACGYCNAENDIAARQCHQCQELLVDPDKRLQEALKLKDKKVLRCSGMLLESTLSKKSQARLKVTYFDEDGGELSELFALQTAAQQGAFYHNFTKLHIKDTTKAKHFRPLNPQGVVAFATKFRHPDFVIANQVKGKAFRAPQWNICEKLFDYEGRYRRAHELG